ncbi:MAG: IclR family transcriptional regulator domain-containing protein [Nocardioidaceae bacterium]
MPRRDNDPDFIEAVARGLDVLTAFPPGRQVMTLSEIAATTELARPTVRRILVTLEALGYTRSVSGGFMLTPRVLEIGLTYVQSIGLWDVARPHLERLVGRTHESSSIAQLDGSDIIYVARVAVPKIIALAVQIGTRFPAPPTSLGKVLLSDLDPTELGRVLAQPSRSGITPRHHLDEAELGRVLRDVRAKGWAHTDEQLAGGIRSVAAPLRDGSGRVIAAMNVTVHAAETSVETLLDEYLPLLVQTASEISAEYALMDQVPSVVVAGHADERH